MRIPPKIGPASNESGQSDRKSDETFARQETNVRESHPLRVAELTAQELVQQPEEEEGSEEQFPLSSPAEYFEIENEPPLLTEAGKESSGITLYSGGSSELVDFLEPMTVLEGLSPQTTVSYVEFNDDLSVTIERTGLSDGPDAAAITFTGQNDAPSLANNSLSVDEGATVVLSTADLSATDAEDTAANLTFTVSGVTAGSFQLVADGSTVTSFTQQDIVDGKIQFVHDGSETAPAYSVSVADSGGLSDGPDAAAITFTGQNDAPSAVDDNSESSQNTTVNLNQSAIIDVLANDGDPDGDTISILSVTDGTNGAVVDNGDGTLTYTPDQSYVGADTFTYTISDGNGGTDTATVTVDVIDRSNDPTFVTGILQTNSTGGANGQALVMTFVSTINPVIAYASVFDTNLGGNTSWGLAFDTGMDISSGDLYFGLEAASLADTQAKSLIIDAASLTVDSKKYSLEADDTNSPGDQFGISAIVTPGSAAVPQDSVSSIDGARSGSTGASDTLTDTGDGTFNYLWGGGNTDTLNGSADADLLSGGDDADAVFGGANNDILVYDPADTTLDGGADIDILRIDIDTNNEFLGLGSNDVDLTGNMAIENIEVILLMDDINQTTLVGLDLTLSATDVLDFTDSDNELYIVGNAGDTLTMGSGWTQQPDEAVATATFNVFTQLVGLDTVTIKVEDDINIL